MASIRCCRPLLNLSPAMGHTQAGAQAALRPAAFAAAFNRAAPSQSTQSHVTFSSPSNPLATSITASSHCQPRTPQSSFLPSSDLHSLSSHRHGATWRFLGRRCFSTTKVSMGLTTGIVGLPNVGKSTLFNALVENGKAQAANFPFCTIEPNVGIVAVPDSRLQVRRFRVQGGQARF